jgi:hypothetical protein
MRVRAARDIGGPLGVAVRRGTPGSVVYVSRSTVMVQFDGGRCLGVPRRDLERLPLFQDR